MKISGFFLSCVLIGLLAACTSTGFERNDHAPTARQKSDNGLELPIHYSRLANGLKVVISEDHTAPIATVAVYYNIGFRIEPKHRTGFAHLFEHMMFQGSENLGKMEFMRLVQSNGGVSNGSTRLDVTNYYEAVPSNKIETMLWAEADRMKGLVITEDSLDNQKEVVKNEVKVRVLNQPYGGFPSWDIPAYVNENWHNNHNFLGDMEDLDAATLDDVQDFFNTYYRPNNAVLVVVGDINTNATLKMINQYFGAIASGPKPPPVDISEPRQEKEKRAIKIYPDAPRPALALAYHMPPRNTPEYFAMGIINEILLSGNDSRLYQQLVKESGVTAFVSGGINLGNLYNYNGPMTWYLSLIHDPIYSSTEIVTLIDQVIDPLRAELVSVDDIELAKTKIRSSFYDALGSSTKFGVVDLLACFALFDDDPGRINRVEQDFAAVTPALIKKTAQEYLRRGNRLVLEVNNQSNAAAIEVSP